MSEPILSTRGLSKSFGALKAASDITLDLKPGEIHAVIGPNGAGKSTLIGLISGTLAPDDGQVALAGQDVTSLGPEDRAKAGLGRTFQISALAMEDTVLENALLGAVGATRQARRLFSPVQRDTALTERAMTALTRVGLDKVKDTRCAELSHGQRRQLEVAVALTLAPKAFVMDEPMAGLGAEGSKTMTGFLDTLRAEAPILLVEHDMDAVFALADRVSVMVYGKLIATGTVDEIRASRDVQDAYLGSDA